MRFQNRIASRSLAWSNECQDKCQWIGILTFFALLCKITLICNFLLVQAPAPAHRRGRERSKNPPFRDNLHYRYRDTVIHTNVNLVLITRWQPEWRFLSQCDNKSQSQNCYYTIHDHLFNTKQFGTTVRVITRPCTMHTMQYLNEKSLGPFPPAGLEVQARPGPRAARPVTISSQNT